MILPASQPLSSASSADLSLLSFNILLPNSRSGWWVFKYYNPSTPYPLREWPHRQKLLREILLSARADILCLQEVVADSFDDDLGFLREAGYDHALHRKGDLRCATFWLRERFSLAAEPQHKDRVLLVSLAPHEQGRGPLHVANAHLIAGPSPGRRLRQVEETLDQARKEATRLKQDIASTPVILCGDFNSEPDRSAVQRLLSGLEVDSSFREPGYPEELTSRTKKQPFGPFTDAYDAAYQGAPPPSMLLADRRPFFGNKGEPSPRAIDALRALFRRFAGDQPALDPTAIEAWITAINRAPGRGSELDKACAITSKKDPPLLTEQEFVDLYLAELIEGKPWGVIHDLFSCGVVEPFPPAPLTARYDQIQFAGPLDLVAVREPISPEQQALVDQGDTLPNAWHPSDHLPIGAVLRWR